MHSVETIVFYVRQDGALINVGISAKTDSPCLYLQAQNQKDSSVKEAQELRVALEQKDLSVKEAQELRATLEQQKDLSVKKAQELRASLEQRDTNMKEAQELRVALEQQRGVVDGLGVSAVYWIVRVCVLQRVSMSVVKCARDCGWPGGECVVKKNGMCL